MKACPCMSCGPVSGESRVVVRASVEFVQEIAVSLQPVGGVRLICPLNGAVILQFLVAQL
jgi:hypothetical protein